MGFKGELSSTNEMTVYMSNDLIVTKPITP